jgi:threonine synthase
MEYLSTRGADRGSRFLEILLGGLMTDGGLSTPLAYPHFSPAELAALRPLNYPELAFAVLSRLITDIPAQQLRTLIHRAYTPEIFAHTRADEDPRDITPLRTLSPGLHLLALSNGPTLAFKDIAMQLLGQLFEYALAQRNESINILGATSGDTGSSAEYAMLGKRGVRVFMLSPHQRMSEFQTAQMFSLLDPHIHNLAVRGVFDDCQNIIKEVSADLAFKARYKIGAVNSINWARVAAQTVYYFKGYFAATTDNETEVSFCVPSGNFGNIHAGWVAKQMGLPIRRLVLATNENDVLDEFFRTGLYRPRGSAETHQTSSPSMDISRASNFERFVFDLVGRDPARLNHLWQQLHTDGFFHLGGDATLMARLRDSGFVSGRSTHTDRLRTIRHALSEYQLLIDTHTADGLKVAAEHREPGVPMICLETALPAKFAATVREAIGRDPDRPAAFADLESKPRRFEVIDASTQLVKDYIAAHA